MGGTLAGMLCGQSEIPRRAFAAGGHSIASIHSVRYTIGEPVVGSAIAASHTLQAGFWRYDPRGFGLQVDRFSATAGPARVMLRWVVVLPTDLDLFLIRRATSPSGPFTPLPNIVVTGPGSYEHLDDGLPLGPTYYYELIGRHATGQLEPIGVVMARPYDLTLSGSVLQVGPAGAHVTIQSAVLAAATAGPTVTIVVEPGTYPSFDVTAAVHSLRIVGDGTGSVRIDTSTGPVRLQGSATPTTLELRNLELGSPTSGNPGLSILNCSGQVVLDNLVVRGSPGHAGITVSASQRVALQRTITVGEPGLSVQQGSTVFANAGAANHVAVAGASRVTACEVGIGSSEHAPDSTIHLLPGSAVHLDAPAMHATGARLEARVEQDPTSLWLLGMAWGVGWYPELGGLWDMVVLLDLPSAVVLHVGVTDPLGRGTFSLDVPAGIGLEGAELVLQSLGITATMTTWRPSNASTLFLAH